MRLMTPSTAVVFDLFHTLVDPEDFRPHDFKRLEALSDEIGLVVRYNAFDAMNDLVTSAEQERRAGQAHVSIDTIEDLTAHLHDVAH